MSKKKIERSGVLPYYIDEGQIKLLFMKPSDPTYGGDCFQMAKGKHEEGEDPKEAGLREAQEELGLFVENVIDTHKLGNFLGRTHVYVCKIKDPAPDRFGDPCSETAATKWMTPDEFQAEGRDLHKPVVKAAVRWIKEKEASVIKEQLELLEYFAPNLFEMSNFNSERTGLMSGTNLWIRTEPVELPHVKFRFKLSHPQYGDAVFGFWGDTVEQVGGEWELTGKDLKAVQEFATKHRQALIDHINGKIDSGDLADAFRGDSI